MHQISEIKKKATIRREVDKTFGFGDKHDTVLIKIFQLWLIGETKNFLNFTDLIFILPYGLLESLFLNETDFSILSFFIKT